MSGSGAAGGMDAYSDLDLGFLCESAEAREKIWKERFSWEIPGTFHRMDADHVKSYFIIYLCEPTIHVDLCFYTINDLPGQAGAPFKLAWDENKALAGWISKVNEPALQKPDWSNVVHEEERFWTWTHYCWGHVGRGEYYDIATWAYFLNRIPEQWQARLNGKAAFDSRKLEARGHKAFIEKMKHGFPNADRESLKKWLQSLIALHNEQRIEVEKGIGPKWTTTQYARDKITKLVNEI
jgi:hypothetical protein